MKNWLRLWPFAQLNVMPEHAIPETQNWYEIMTWIWSDDTRRANFEKSVWRAFDEWKARTV